MRPEVCVFAAQMNRVAAAGSAALRHIRQAFAAGGDENTLLPHYGMCLGELCTIAQLQELRRTVRA